MTNEVKNEVKNEIKNEVKVIYPGSFDPLTYGHLDIIYRIAPTFNNIILAIVDNPSKSCTFTIKERELMLSETISNERLEDKVSVMSFNGLLVDFAQSQGARLLVRGIRALSDFEFEFRSSRMNKYLNKDIETIFMLSSPKYEHISSSIVKEVYKLGADIKEYVPENIIRHLAAKLKTHDV